MHRKQLSESLELLDEKGILGKGIWCSGWAAAWDMNLG